MTDQQSLDDIERLLLIYPGMSSAVVFRVPERDEVHIRIRCNDVKSLRALAALSVWANVSIRLGNPNMRLCAELEGVTDLPCDVSITDSETDVPTHPQRFGVYVSDDLERQGLITLDEMYRLHERWNTKLMRSQPDESPL